jgi:hypothetical protein
VGSAADASAPPANTVLLPWATQAVDATAETNAIDEVKAKTAKASRAAMGISVRTSLHRAGDPATKRSGQLAPRSLRGGISIRNC